MKHQITSEFATLIGSSRLDKFNSHPSSVYGLDSEFNIAYLNPAWFEFAEENNNKIFDINDWSLGRNIFESIPGFLNLFYKNLFESALIEQNPPLISIQSAYECSSPELYRHFSMHLYQINNEGLVVVNSLLIEKTHTIPAVSGLKELEEGNYIDKNGLILQCSNCRRIKHLKEAERWDWIPEFIEKPYSKTSHGVCLPCMKHYYQG